MRNLTQNLFQKKFITLLITANALIVNVVHGDEHSLHKDNHSAQEQDHMHDHGDDPVVTKVMFDQLELRNTDDENSKIMDVQAWIGKDLNKFWLKADVEKYSNETEAELQALYSRAISSYWDLQIGLRKDIKPEPAETWGVIGFQGLAPYFFHIDAALFIGESGRTAATLSAEYDVLFTQRLILSPEVEINLYGQNDEVKMIGSGLSDINAGLRLRYEIIREFAPYVGVNWSKKWGNTAHFSKATNTAVSDTEWLVGVRVWF